MSKNFVNYLLCLGSQNLKKIQIDVNITGIEPVLTIIFNISNERYP